MLNSLAHKTRRSFFFTRSSLSRLLLLLMAIVRGQQLRAHFAISFGGQCDLHCLLSMGSERPYVFRRPQIKLNC
jgi:hypothetical protein